MANAAFCYRVGDYRILLEAGIRSEVLGQDAVYPVPYSPDWCVGLTSVRGDLSPVIDMHRVLFRQQRPEKQYLLWLHHEAFAPVVISCDSLPRTVEIPDEDGTAGRVPGLPGWVQSVWAQKEGLLLAADHIRLFKMLSKVRQVA